jgi:DNA-directed RNA polymerase specialized sigma24 family protein
MNTHDPAAVRAALATLSAQARSIVQARADGRPWHEIAKQHWISPATARAIHREAIERLRAMLDPGE